MENYLHNFLGDKDTKDTMYICKGGTIDKEEHILKRIQGKLIVPKYFFVAVLVKKMVKGQAYYKSIGMWFPHTKVYHGDDKLSNYTMSIKDLEAKTGIDFFCNLPDNIERDVESKKSSATGEVSLNKTQQTSIRKKELYVHLVWNHTVPFLFEYVYILYLLLFS